MHAFKSLVPGIYNDLAKHTELCVSIFGYCDGKNYENMMTASKMEQLIFIINQ